MMIRRLAGHVLHATGYELRPLPRRDAGPHADPDEVAALEDDLRTFAALAPECRPWSQPEQAREYLSDERLLFYRDVVAVCREQGVSWGGRRVADVGSGTGYLLRVLAEDQAPRQMVGFDTYPEIRRLAGHLCPDAQFVDRDLFDLDPPQDGERFDVVFCTEVLEHLLHPDRALARLMGLVADGGGLVLTVPDGRQDRFPALEAREDGTGYWGHVNFWSPESWPVFLESAAAGCRVQSGPVARDKLWAIVRRDGGA